MVTISRNHKNHQPLMPHASAVDNKTHLSPSASAFNQLQNSKNGKHKGVGTPQRVNITQQLPGNHCTCITTGVTL